MNPRPDFNVLVTSYNYSNYLEQAVDSALAQTHAPRAILVVDDGSTDGSVDLVRRRYAAEPRVRVIEQVNQGQMVAFASGVRAADADAVVAFLDADDCWDSSYLASVADGLQRLPAADYVYSNLRFIADRSGTYHHRRHSADDGRSVLAGCYARSWRGSPTSAVCIRHALARRLVDLPAALAREWRTRADDALTYGADILGARKLYLSTALACYRVHGQNAYIGHECDADSAASSRHLEKIERLVAHYRAMAGIDGAQRSQQCRGALEEFRTKPAPVKSDLKRYLQLVALSDLGPAQKLAASAQMWRHYLASRRRLPARPPA